MTTKYTFFNKLFEENEKAKNLYKNYNFEEIPDDYRWFLNKLTIISKYKSYFKDFLLSRKINDREKLDYIYMYKPSLNYPEYIKFNNMIEDCENSLVHTLYIIGGVNIALLLYFVAKRDVHQPLMKEMTFSVLLSLLSGFAFHQYNKIAYRKKLSELYLVLEGRMNLYPELKMSSANKNYMSDDNYDETVEDSL